MTAGAGNFAVHADAFKRHAGDYDTPHGRIANSFVDNEGFSVGTLLVGSERLHRRLLHALRQPLRHPRREAAKRARIDMKQDKVQSRGEWRVRGAGIEAIRYWFGMSDYAHNEIVFEAEPRARSARCFTNKEYEGRVEVQHLPVMTAFGELRGAVGTQFGQRKTYGD